MVIIGINGSLDFDGRNAKSWVHGSGATLMIDGCLKGSTSEERFSRTKYDGLFPKQSIDSLLDRHALTHDDVDSVNYVPNCVNTPEFEYQENEIKQFLGTVFPKSKITITDHHLAHAATAVLTAPFDTCNFLTIDNAGNFYRHNGIIYQNWGSFGMAKTWPFDLQRHKTFYATNNNDSLSLGHFYNLMSAAALSKITQKDFFHNKQQVESVPGKIMGLAAYGQKTDLPGRIFFTRQITAYDIPDIECYIDFTDEKFLLMLDSYQPADIAYWLQNTFENTVLDFLDHIPKSMRSECLAFAGGCALNISTNSKIISEGLYKDVHVPTAPNDDGLHQGAALLACAELGIKPELPKNLGCIGASYDIDRSYISNRLNMPGDPTQNLELLSISSEQVCEFAAQALSENKLVAWFQGRSEFGPRALGNRSILAHPGHANKDLLNSCIKFREHWRPYAAMVMQEHVHDWFDLAKSSSPYMLFNSTVRDDKRDIIPSVTHEDFTCRIQTVDTEINPRAYELLKLFYDKTGIPLLLNTSFNTIPGEPIVENPRDALNSFYNSRIDILVINDLVISRR